MVLVHMVTPIPYIDKRVVQVWYFGTHNSLTI